MRSSSSIKSGCRQLLNTLFHLFLLSLLNNPVSNYHYWQILQFPLRVVDACVTVSF